MRFGVRARRRAPHVGHHEAPPMRMTSKFDEISTLAFAEKAAAHFAQHPEHWTFTDGEINPGCFFAVRWGGGNDCVLVLKLDDFHEPVNYQNLIRPAGNIPF